MLTPNCHLVLIVTYLDLSNPFIRGTAAEQREHKQTVHLSPGQENWSHVASRSPISHAVQK